MTLALNAVRWSGVFGKSLEPRYRSLTRALDVGKLLSSVVQGAIGEADRFVVLGHDEGLSQAKVMGTLAAEKGIGLLILALVTGPAPSWPSARPA